MMIKTAQRRMIYKNSMKSKTIGVLGGMGPESTALFFQKVIQLTPALRDQEHIPVIIYSNPKIPDRTEAILNQGESPLPALLKGIAVLEHAGADFICIPCNTAHYYYKQITEASSIPVLNLIDEVVKAALNENVKIKRMGLLATIGAIKARLYQNAFQEYDIEVIIPDEWELNDLHSGIHRLKSNSKDSYSIQKFAETLIKKEVQALILGCTELSLIRSDLSLNVPILDSIEILAKRAVDKALSDLSL